MSFLVLCCFTPFVSAEVKSLLWKGVPVPLDVKPGDYQLIIFDSDVVIDVPDAITPMLTVFATRPGYVVFNPTKSFQETTIQITKTDGSAGYLLNLRSTPRGSGGTRRWIDALAKVDRQEIHPQKTTESTVKSKRGLLPRIALARHASQTLYAPQRLIPASKEITRLPIKLWTNLSLIETQNGESFDYEMVGAWQGYGMYITAILVKNLSNISVELDPRLVKYGEFNGVFFQHHRLAIAGSPDDHTTLYLTSTQPFERALKEAHYDWHQ